MSVQGPRFYTVWVKTGASGRVGSSAHVRSTPEAAEKTGRAIRASLSAKERLGLRTDRCYAGRRRRSAGKPRACVMMARRRVSRGVLACRVHVPIMLRSYVPKLSNNIIQKGLAFGRDWSGTVGNPGRPGCSEILPRRLVGRGGASVVAARRRREPNGGFRCQSLQNQLPRGSERLHRRQGPLLPQSQRNRPRET
jgi:hypothetical protein